MDMLVQVQHTGPGAVQDRVPEQAGLLRLPVGCCCSPEARKVLFAVARGGVDLGWHAAQSKDPSVVLQGDYAASDALPTALSRPYAPASGPGWRDETLKKKAGRRT